MATAVQSQLFRGGLKNNKFQLSSLLHVPQSKQAETHVDLGSPDLIRNQNKDLIKRVTQCIKTCMRIAGLYYGPLVHCVSYVKAFFPLFLLGLTFSETCFFFNALEPSDGFKTRMIKVQAILDIFKVTILQVIFIFRITPKMRHFYRSFADYAKDFNSGKYLHEITLPLKKYIVFGYFLLTPVFVGLNIMMIYLGIVPLSLMAHTVMQSGIQIDKTGRYVLASFSSLLFTFYEFINTTGFIFVFYICYLLGHEYTVMTSEFRHQIKENDSDQKACDAIIVKFRRRLLRLNRLTGHVNMILEPLILVTILFSLVLCVCHLLFFIDMGSYALPENYLISFFILSGMDRIVHLGYFLHAGIMLHVKACVVRQTVLFLNIENKSQKFYQEAMMLIQKLNLDHIGLSAYGLININKPFIMTVFTLGASYAIIMLRFGLTYWKDEDPPMTESPFNFTGNMTTAALPVLLFTDPVVENYTMGP